MSVAKDTYISSVKTAETNLTFAGDAGNATGTLIPNNTNDFPSLAAIESAYANGAITVAQRVALRQQSIMHAQTKIQTAKDVLRASESV
jgi:predicted secreted protein